MQRYGTFYSISLSVGCHQKNSSSLKNGLELHISRSNWRKHESLYCLCAGSAGLGCNMYRCIPSIIVDLCDINQVTWRWPILLPYFGSKHVAIPGGSMVLSIYYAFLKSRQPAPFRRMMRKRLQQVHMGHRYRSSPTRTSVASYSAITRRRISTGA